MSSGEPILETTDFRHAGFLVSKGHRLDSWRRNDRGETVFRFGNEDGVASRCLAGYPGSPEQVYDAACRSMHDLTRARRRTT